MKTKAILFVAYGIVDNKTRANTIGKLVKVASELFPNYDIRVAFTSEFMIKKVLEKGIKINNISNTLKDLAECKITEVILQPLHIIYGGEYERMYYAAKELRYLFQSIKIGQPLLGNTQDYFEICELLDKEYGVDKKECLVLMGHGSEHYANSSYSALAYTLKQRNYKNIFIGALEAYPSIDVILQEIKDYSPKKVKLVPFLFAVASHAKEDMAGEKETSWKSQIEKLGYPVEVVMKGLADSETFRNIFINHLVRTINE